MSSEKLRAILVNHADRYPEWAVEDLYKLIHQASMGSEHAILDPSHAREWLTRELEQLDAGPVEPLVDAISPDGRIVRVHLRPYVALRLEPELLLQAFIQTASRFPPSPERLTEYAGVAAELAEARMLHLPCERLVEWFDEMRAKGYPAIHHSPGFERLYRPAYRVVLDRLLPKEILIADGTTRDPGSAESHMG